MYDVTSVTREAFIINAFLVMSQHFMQALIRSNK